MRLAASIAPAVVLALALSAAGGPAFAGLYDEFKAICRDTDTAKAAAAAAAQRLGYGPVSAREARQIAGEMADAVALKRVRGKEEAYFVAGTKMERQRALDACMLMSNRAPATEAKRLRDELGQPTMSVLGQQTYGYTRTLQGNVPIPPGAKAGQVKGEAKDARFILIGRMLGATMFMLTRPRS